MNEFIITIKNTARIFVLFNLIWCLRTEILWWRSKWWRGRGSAPSGELLLLAVEVAVAAGAGAFELPAMNNRHIFTIFINRTYRTFGRWWVSWV